MKGIERTVFRQETGLNDEVMAQVTLESFFKESNVEKDALSGKMGVAIKANFSKT